MPNLTVKKENSENKRQKVTDTRPESLAEIPFHVPCWCTNSGRDERIDWHSRFGRHAFTLLKASEQQSPQLDPDLSFTIHITTKDEDVLLYQLPVLSSLFGVYFNHITVLHLEVRRSGWWINLVTVKSKYEMLRVELFFIRIHFENTLELLVLQENGNIPNKHQKLNYIEKN